LPFGIGRVYPKENAGVYEAIARDGLLLTEVHPEAPPSQGMFQARDRIVALLAEALIVIEAATKSGTLMAANLALDLGCEVMAVPGSPVDARSFGSNCLIKNGATLVQNSRDVLEALGFEGVPSEAFEASRGLCEGVVENEALVAVLSALSAKPVSLDVILAGTNLNMQQLLPVISELEITGKVIRHPTDEVSLA
jgi:DNA processing protein